VNRRWLPWLGGFLFVLAQLIIVLFGVDGLAEPRVALQYGVMTLAALLLLAAGARERYAAAGREVRWNHLAGVSMVLLGAGLAVSYLASLADDVTTVDAAFVVIAAVGSLTLVWFGYQVAYATRHVRVEPDPREECR
jgi:threonine/homoserine/homoserine lactone efflux protein